MNDKGIEYKGEMMLSQKLGWRSLKIEEKSNGIINLYDTSIPAFTRRMKGEGWIQIQPEINNREQLLSTLYANQSKYQGK
ncbi:hypothetical protein [Mucilaginibacter gotjawali]|uniref:Ribosome biogenesis GTPase A n=1 Tax=Mucilaginibacter gotjawali TaxID=1550579 RepID=A0A839SCL4_9SPHI|nr:hypothetical protein [Mucilaginibacter gotjawali]MBB3055013.1 ribosome biogenesis GTPase A [Mucilaginibacter gotjawali]